MIIIFWISAAILFIISAVIYWKISDFFLSAVEVVNMSRFGYWCQKFFGSIFIGLLLVGLLYWVWSPYEEKTETESPLTSISAPKETQSAPTPTESVQAQNNTNLNNSSQSQTDAIDCRQVTDLSKLICSDKNLLEANNKSLSIYMKAKSRDAGFAADIRNDMMNSIKSCNLDAQCIYFAYEKASNNLQVIADGK
jgi:hypothetical protein